LCMRTSEENGITYKATVFR